MLGGAGVKDDDRTGTQRQGLTVSCISSSVWWLCKLRGSIS